MFTSFRSLRRRIAFVLMLTLSLCALRIARAADRDAATAAAVGQRAQAEAASRDERLDDLIQELGSPQFTVRRAAANEIRKIGPEAFDRLHAATENADPEIAASANYLMRQIAVRWTSSDDSATVRRLMRGFGDREDNERQRIIQMLAAMPGGEGIGALCRVARFDRTPLLSRLAAVAVLQSDDDALGGTSANETIDPAVFDRELGQSARAPVLWLRQFQVQLRDPAASVAGWQRLIDEETKRLDVNVSETSPAIASALLWNLADVYRQLGQTQPLVQTANRILVVGGADSERLLGTFLQWLVQHQSWDALEQLAAEHDEQIEKSKRTLYLLALARTKQNKAQAAEELARRAAKLTPAKTLDGFEAAQLLVALGQFDWAVREYRSGIEGKPVEETVAIASRVKLSDLLQDYERYDAAADTLEPLVSAIENNPDIARAYASAQSGLAQQNQYLPESESLDCRFHFLRACHFEQEHDFKKQREELLAAIKHDETDADVLISMFRLSDADDAWMADTRERIDKLSRKVEEEIADNPNNPLPYNQWAWLIANTEGDFGKAVRYSRRSLELEPDTASFLDTLGRCYYSAGDYAKAVESQRQAVHLIPHMQVMQRQLKQFEKTLAEKQGAGSKEQGAAKAN
jgi:tetratricopeptide (TPR) repeat protein